MANTQNAGSTHRRTRYLVRKDEPTGFMPTGFLPLLGLLIVFLFALLPFAFSSIQATAKDTAEVALLKANADWASVDVSGQWITLKGQAPSNTAARAAKRVVENATRPALFGIKARPVTRVINELTVASAELPTPQAAPVVQNHDWTFTLDRSVLELSGEVPDEATRQTLLNAAQSRITPPRLTAIENKLRLTGHPANTTFTETSLRGINTLSRCDAGVSTFTDNVFSLSCQAQSSVASEIELIANTQLPFGTLGRVDIYTQEAADTCNQALLDLLTTTRIEFASASAQIDPASQTLLDRVGQAAITCPGTLRIEGHTDNSGRSSLNDRLSKSRAQAVRRALIDRGVPAAKLTSEGYGATRPIADNTTPAGRARNRRIEIKVSATPN